MSGMAIGMNFINKGIDQFSYGVDQEYKRHTRHRLRDYSIDDQNNTFSREFKQKMAMAEKFGIHPLVMAGASGSGIPGQSSPSSVPPSGGGNPVISTRQSPEEKRILSANARKAEAEATIMEQEANNSGQGNAGTVGNTGAAPPGQTDGPSGSVGNRMQSAVTFAEEYTVDSEGHAYIKPTQSNEQAFGEEGTYMNRALYNARKLNYPRKIRSLLKNYNAPQNQELKKQWLSTRPYDPSGKFTFLWDYFGWKRVPLTNKNRGKLLIGKDNYPQMIPQNRKQKYHKFNKNFGGAL